MFYLLTKYFLKLCAAFFFQEVDRVGEHHTPISGPLIICGNHSNQFVDPLLILSQCKRETSFLIAESSYKKRIVGFFAKLLHAIPVKRPQDYAKKGTGKISSDVSGKILGIGTKFASEVKPGDMIKAGSIEFTIKSVDSDDLLTPINAIEDLKDSDFKILPKIDQSEIYEAVQNELKRGRCIGIFPEGGSHDRTTPLPLKAGVCLMALGAMARYNITVTIQCIGLNYYQGHRFRSKAVLNFGVPYSIPRELATLYLQDRKQAIEILLRQIESRMKEVWVTAQSYEELSHVFMARRVFKPDDMENPSKLMEMNIKFAKGYRYIKEKYPDCEEFKTAVALADDYTKNLKLFGLKDSQVRSSKLSKGTFLIQTVFSIIRIILAFVLSLPTWIIAVVLGTLIYKQAEKERQKALASSSVKIHGWDVLASFKIIYGFTYFAIFSLLLGIFVFFYSVYLFDSYYDALSIYITFLIIWPSYMYVSIILSDRALNNFTKIYIRALSICSPKAINSVIQQREKLKESVKALVKKFMPEIFPNLKLKKSKSICELNDSINDAFSFLSEIGFS